MAKVVRSEEVAPQPWANGGGTTRELLVADDGSWRISLADVSRDGPFASFPGRRRLLTVVAGPVLALVVDGVDHVVEPHRPFVPSNPGVPALGWFPRRQWLRAARCVTVSTTRPMRMRSARLTRRVIHP